MSKPPAGEPGSVPQEEWQRLLCPVWISNPVPHWPTTIAQAVDRILAKLTAAEKAAIRRTPDDDLDGLHLGLGTGVRNECGLWDGSTALLASCGPPGMHPIRRRLSSSGRCGSIFGTSELPEFRPDPHQDLPQFVPALSPADTPEPVVPGVAFDQLVVVGA